MSDASEDIKKSSRGRPKADTTPVMVRMAPAELEAVDQFRRGLADVPTRPEAIRRLVQKGLAADEAEFRQVMKDARSISQLPDDSISRD